MNSLDLESCRYLTLVVMLEPEATNEIYAAFRNYSFNWCAACFCSVSEHSEEAYRMGRRRGKLVLICNTRFDPRLKLKDRKGTERDIDAIKCVFGDRLHFEVQECSQLKAHEMQREIANG